MHSMMAAPGKVFRGQWERGEMQSRVMEGGISSPRLGVAMAAKFSRPYRFGDDGDAWGEEGRLPPRKGAAW